MHRAHRGFDHGRAGVAKGLAWGQMRGFTHHPFAMDFLNLAMRIGNDPVPCKQARRFLALIQDGDGVGEYVATRGWLRVGLQVVNMGVDLDRMFVFHHEIEPSCAGI